MPKRRKPTARQRLEDRVLEMGEGESRLQQQDRLIALNHTEAENNLARRRCREFLEGGWGAIDWLEPGGHWADAFKDFRG